MLQTVVEELAITPYTQVTVERIAEASRAHKTTLYRWWSGKPELVAYALAAVMDIGRVPDTGSTRSELVECLTGHSAQLLGLAARYRDACPHWRLASTPQGPAAFRHTFLSERRANCAVVIERGVARGDLPAELDVDLFMDTLADAVFYRQVVTGVGVEAAIAGQVVDLLLQAPVVTAS